jgi:Uncharacterised nucleotidyltransferase
VPSPRFTGSFWPSPIQERLLRTALAGPPAGQWAWRELAPGFELQTLEPGTVSVLPLVYRAVSAGSPEDPLLSRLKGIYRNTWVKNNLLAERLAEVVQAFDAAGIEHLLIAGLAAAVRYYPEPGLRPTPTLDLLVASDALISASRVLGRLGWSSSGPAALGAAPLIAFGNAHGQTCLLRITPAVDLQLPVDELRAVSTPVQIGRATVNALAPDHELLVACVAGQRRKPVRSVQWLVDVAQILTTAGAELDWQRLEALAAGHGQALRLRQALGYVAGVLEVPVPAAGAQMLDSLVIPGREHLAYACAGAAVRGLGSLPQAIGEHLVATRERSVIAAALTFPGFLRRRWGVDHGWQLPLAGGRRAYGLITGGRREGPA